MRRTISNTICAAGCLIVLSAAGATHYGEYTAALMLLTVGAILIALAQGDE